MKINAKWINLEAVSKIVSFIPLLNTYISIILSYELIHDRIKEALLKKIVKKLLIKINKDIKERTGEEDEQITDFINKL